MIKNSKGLASYWASQHVFNCMNIILSSLSLFGLCLHSTPSGVTSLYTTKNSQQHSNQNQQVGASDSYGKQYLFILFLSQISGTITLQVAWFNTLTRSLPRFFGWEGKDLWHPTALPGMLLDGSRRTSDQNHNVDCNAARTHLDDLCIYMWKKHPRHVCDSVCLSFFFCVCVCVCVRCLVALWRSFQCCLYANLTASITVTEPTPVAKLEVGLRAAAKLAKCH